MIVRELITKLGFNIDEVKLNKFESSIKSVKTNLKAIEPVAKKMSDSVRVAQNKLLASIQDGSSPFKLSSLKDVSGKFQTVLKDSQGVIKYVKNAEGIFVKFTSEVTKNSSHFNSAIESVENKLKSINFVNIAKKISLAFIGVAGGALALGVSTAKTVDEMQKLANQIGIDTTTLQELELAAQNSGLQVDELSNSFSKFSKYTGDVALSSSGTSAEFRKLGINIKNSNGQIKDIDILYGEAAQKIDNLSNKSLKASLSNKLFGTSNIDLVKFMGQSTDAIEKQREEVRKLGYVVDKDGVKNTTKFLQTWSKFKSMATGIRNELGVKLLPVLNKIITKFTNWFMNNRKLISSGLNAFITGLTFVLKSLYQIGSLLITLFEKLSDALGGAGNVFRIFSGIVIALGAILGVRLVTQIWTLIKAIRILSVTFLASPIGLITGLVIALGVAIGLLVDDIYHWVNDGESLIGEFLGNFEEFKNNFLGIWDLITDGVEEALTNIGNFGQKIFDGIVDNIMAAFDKIMSVVNTVKNLSIFGDSNNQGPLKFKSNGESRKVSSIDLNDYKKSQTPAGVDLSPSLSPIQPILNPSNDVMNGTTISNNNRINQNITENIVVNVPVGTSEQQLRAINTQITQAVQEQFNYNISRAIDSIATR
jgi:hypothetical protein